MILKRVRITNFQSIRDSTVELGDVTCLVGKNEAGKTAPLKASYRLDPIRTSDATEFYLRLVNGKFGRTIQSTELAVGHPRVLRRIEDHLTENPPLQEVRFSHYRPARYLSENVNSLAGHLRDEDLGRFEAVFRAANAFL